MQDQRLASVEYVRGLAAAAVVWFHFTQGNKDYLPEGFIKYSGELGYLGVEAFFVMSGFIIPLSLYKRRFAINKDGLSFLLRRILRLEPPYFVAILLSLVLAYLSPLAPDFRGIEPVGLFTDALLHPLYLVPWFNGRWLNPVFWTLAIEFQYYLLMVFITPILLSRYIWYKRFLIIMILIVPFAHPDGRTVFAYLPLFGFGFLAFLVAAEGLENYEYAFWLIALAVSSIENLGFMETIVSLATVALLAVRWPKQFRMMGWLGAISYSLYLVHVPIGGRVINIFSRFPDLIVVKILGLISAVLLSIASAYVLWRFVELRSQEAAQAIAGGGRPRSSSAASSRVRRFGDLSS